MTKREMIDTSRMPSKGYLSAAQLIGRGPSPRHRRPAIPALLPISQTTFYDWVKKGIFPQPIRLSRSVVIWRVKDVRAFLEGKFVDGKFV